MAKCVMQKSIGRYCNGETVKKKSRSVLQWKHCNEKVKGGNPMGTSLGLYCNGKICNAKVYGGTAMDK